MTRMVSILIKKIKLLFLPKNRRIYVVLQGKLKGEWLVKVNQTSEEITFFSLPDKYVHTINKKDLDFGLKNNILEPVDVLPAKVYDVCIAEYNYKATDVKQDNTFNRWEQHPTSNSLGSKQHRQTAS